MDNDMLFRKLVHSAFDIGFAYLDDLPSQRHQILERIRNEREQKHNYLPIILILFIIFAALIIYYVLRLIS